MKQIYLLYGIPCRIQSTLTALSLSLFLLLSETSAAQVNAYARVSNINGNKTRLSIENLNETYHSFAAGEEVIVLQMQDAVIGANTTNNADFGKLAAIKQAGLYEIAVISTINNDRSRITLTAALHKDFNLNDNSSVQVISFTKLSTTNFTTTADIQAVAWNSSLGTGGVVAFQVGGTLTLRHAVTADGQGFAGGGISDNYENGCAPDVYQTNSNRYGAKGEGIYLADNNAYLRGRGRLLNGGGGGSDDNGGGAGGGNFTAGGEGGPGWTCSTNPSGGLGGIALNTYLMTGTRLFMGGGGGGGQGNNSTQTAGAAGGGIIIIKANTITTGCTSSSVRISANGNAASPTSGTGNDGAGGAGAGGTILFQVNSFTIPVTCPLQIRANGGNGGDVSNSGAHGGGGGGGQGAVLFSKSLPTTNVAISTTNGTGGLNSSETGATRAGNGGGNANGGIISGVGSVLPVQLISFTTERLQQKVGLRWTATDDANTLFTIKHGTDGIHFIAIGHVNGKGNNTTTTQYTFTDPRPTPGKNYYQLQMTDQPSGLITWSAIESVTMSEASEIPVAWPNPAHDHFNIRVNAAYSNKPHEVVITNLTGKVIYRNTYKPVSGIITVTPAHLLQPGLYMYRLLSEGYEQSGKLIIR